MAFGFSLIFMYMILPLNSKVSSTHHDPAGRPHHIPFALLSSIILGQSMTILLDPGHLSALHRQEKRDFAGRLHNVLRHRAAEDANEVPQAYRRNGEFHRDGESRRKNVRWQRWVSHQSEEKRTRLWAIIEANRTRLRSILMTTLMLIAGMVPSPSARAPARQPRLHGQSHRRRPGR